jgi:hypothetical protein
MAPGATATNREARADVSIAAAIRVIPSAWFTPNPRVYWTDMLTSALVGWTAFVFGVLATGFWIRAALLILAAFALYRAVLLIHELTHLLDTCTIAPVVVDLVRRARTHNRA